MAEMKLRHSDKTEEMEKGFQEALADTLAYVRGMKPFCTDLDELTESIEYALSSRPALKMQMELVAESNSKK